jgi:tetratricopeptide (TPR) repeat protein
VPGQPYTTVAAPFPAQEVPIKKEVDLPPRDPKPLTCLKGGDLMLAGATAPGRGPGEKQQFFERARKAYQQAISLDPKFLPAYQALARLYVLMEDERRAVETYQKAIKLKSDDASLWYELGMCYKRQKDWEPALEHLTKAAELEPETSKYVNTLAVVLACAGRYQESLECFTRLGSQAKAHYKLAKTLERLNQPELSKQHLAVALEMDPRLADPPVVTSAEPVQKPEPMIQPVVHLAVQPLPEETGPAPGRSPSSAVCEKQPNGAAPKVDASHSGGIALPPPPVLNIRDNPAPASPGKTAGGPTG